MATEERSGTAADRAYAHVKQQLLDGTLADGTLISEGTVADAVGISRTPVREAFLALAAEGLLELYPKRGALVVPLTSADVADLFDTRALIEAHCLRRALEADPEGVRRAAAAELARQRRLLAAGDIGGFVEADRAFHRTWMAAGRSAILLSLYDRLRDRQQRVAARVLGAGPRRAEQLLAEHGEILSRLREGDADAAVAALTNHLRAARAMA
jgi:DNA-binding GntR family transcriptional regulator